MERHVPLPSTQIFQRLAIAVFCIGIIMSTGGCRWPWPGQPAVLESGVSPAEMRKYAEAVKTYQTGNYEAAGKSFAAMREQTANPVAARMALYGLACSRLMMATTPKDYQEALALWDTWVHCAPTRQDRENPVLFAPIIKNKMIFSLIPLQSTGGGTGEDNQDDFRGFMLRANNELQRLKRQLESARQGIEDRDKKIKTLEKEIYRLDQQIKAFETIDQKIQKKKNAIPSAD